MARAVGQTTAAAHPSQTQQMHGISALGRNGQPSDNAQDLFNKTMLAINNWANKAPTGSETADTLKVCQELLKTASKRKREEEPEEEDNFTVIETINLVDDSATKVNMRVRQLLRNVNGPPSDWWKPDVMNKVTKPIIGQNLYLDSLMPVRVNAKTIRRCHDRSMLVTCKSLASKNSGVTGERKMQYKLMPTAEDAILC